MWNGTKRCIVREDALTNLESICPLSILLITLKLVSCLRSANEINDIYVPTLLESKQCESSFVPGF